VGLFVGLLLVLAGVGLGFRPLGHVTAYAVSVSCSQDAPSDSVTCTGFSTYRETSTPTVIPEGVDRSCGSAFFPAHRVGTLISNLSEDARSFDGVSWEASACHDRVSTWRYSAFALIAGGLIVAAAGLVVFRARGVATGDQAR
jgi:hypothetical protein